MHEYEQKRWGRVSIPMEFGPAPAGLLVTVASCTLLTSRMQTSKNKNVPNDCDRLTHTLSYTLKHIFYIDI